MADKMHQKSGKDSKNIQIGGDVKIGISAMEARQIAIDVFKANFYEFSENAAKKALERAEELTDNFIEQFYTKIPHLESKLQEPSVQSTMFETQKEYAKTGDKDLKEKLLDLLIQRIDSEERSLKQIVLDEAISILPKLTQDQINVLTLVFSAVYNFHNNILNLPTFIDYINNRLLNFYSQNSLTFSFFTHLQFTGCCTMLTQGSSYKPFEQILQRKYKALFIKGFTETDLKNEFGEDISKLKPLLMRCIQNPSYLQFNPLNDTVFKSKITELEIDEIGNKALGFQNKYLMSNDEIIEFINTKNSLFKRFLSDWKEKDFKTIRPTSVGFVISILNYNRVTGENIPIDQFI